MGGLNITLMIAIALITYDAIVNESALPKPQRYIWTVVVWSVLGLLAGTQAAPLAAAFAFGLVLSLGYTFVTTGKAGYVPNPDAGNKAEHTGA